LSAPAAALNLSARPAFALKRLKVAYVYELVQKSQFDLFRLPNFGQKSLREVEAKLAALGLTLGMTLDDDSYKAAVVATVAANIQATKGWCGMSNRPDPRRIARLTFPPPLHEGAFAHHPVYVLNLSPLGACIRHQALLHDGVVCYLDLPPALGALRLTGQVVWTRLRGTEQTLAGEQRFHYESGIEFTGPTPEQQAALAAALATLQAAQDAPDREPSA